MPSSSKKQAAFMRAAAYSKKFAKRAGIPQSVAKEFAEADKKKAKNSSRVVKRYGKD